LTGPLSNADNFFIVADKYLNNIYQVDAASGSTAQLLPFGTAHNPAAVAYDPTATLVYWTEYERHTINKYSLITNNNTVIYSDPSNTGKDNLNPVHTSNNVEATFDFVAKNGNNIERVLQ